jgi:LysR family transcriptional regulator for metE and metH
VEATSQPVAALLAGELDLALVHSPSADRRLVARPLFKDEMVAVMSPRHPLAGRRHIAPADFADQHLILHSPLKESAVYQQFLLPAGITPARVSQVQLTEVVIEMVKAELGVSFLARWTLKGQIESNELVALPLSRKGFYRCWSAVRLRTEVPSPYLDYFIDLLASNTPEQGP